MPTTASAYAAPAAGQPLERVTIQRRDVRPLDVAVDIEFAGICHSDIHHVRGEWGEQAYPVVPGHEITGRVSAVGSQVSNFAVGDRVGVGVMVESCRECEACQDGEEQYCTEGMVGTYGVVGRDGEMTQGGYSTSIVTDEHFVYPIPEALGLDVAAPLLCAGITVYSPLKHWGVGPGSTVAVVGLGGLGHMAVQFGAALGAEVTVLSQSLAKADDGRRLGATHYYATTDSATFQKCDQAFDLIINTVSANLPLDDYLGLLRRNGTLVELGLPEHPMPVRAHSFAGRRLSLAGSTIGSVRETQEMLELAADSGIASLIETVQADQINDAWDRVVASDVRFRFVIDVNSMR